LALFFRWSKAGLFLILCYYQRAYINFGPIQIGFVFSNYFTQYASRITQYEINWLCFFKIRSFCRERSTSVESPVANPRRAGPAAKYEMFLLCFNFESIRLRSGYAFNLLFPHFHSLFVIQYSIFIILFVTHFTQKPPYRNQKPRY
jgi:hypothetical protein